MSEQNETKNTSTVAVVEDVHVEAHAKTHELTDEQRRANVAAGLSTAAWQVYAMAAQGKALGEIATAVKVSKPTARKYLHIIAMAAAAAGIAEPSETPDGLPQPELATYYEGAEKAVNVLHSASRADGPIVAAIEAQKNARTIALPAIKAHPDFGPLLAEHPEMQQDIEAQWIGGGMAAAAEKRAADLKAEREAVKAENARIEAEAAERAAQDGDKENAAERAAQQRMDAAAVHSADLANGEPSLIIAHEGILTAKVYKRASDGNFVVTPGEAEELTKIAQVWADIAAEARVGMPKPGRTSTKK